MKTKMEVTYKKPEMVHCHDEAEEESKEPRDTGVSCLLGMAVIFSFFCLFGYGVYQLILWIAE